MLISCFFVHRNTLLVHIPASAKHLRTAASSLGRISFDWSICKWRNKDYSSCRWEIGMRFLTDKDERWTSLKSKNKQVRMNESTWNRESCTFDELHNNLLYWLNFVVCSKRVVYRAPCHLLIRSWWSWVNLLIICYAILIRYRHERWRCSKNFASIRRLSMD